MEVVECVEVWKDDGRDLLGNRSLLDDIEKGHDDIRGRALASFYD